MKLRIAGAGLALAIGTTVLNAAPASAATSCSTWLTKQVMTALPDLYYGNVKCSSISINTKVRGGLAIDNDLDCYTGWFTRTNYTYKTCGAARVSGAYYQTATL